MQLSVLDTLPAVAPATGGRSLLGRAARWLPLVSVLAALVTVLVGVDTSVWDVVRYAGYAGWAVLLPGVLVYRALRKTPHSLVDDLAMGAATGLALEIAAFVAFSATGLRGLLWAWPALVVVPFAALRPLRRHWRPTGYRPAPLGWSWAVAGVAVFLLGYLTFAYLKPNQPTPTGGERLYFFDQLYLLSLVGEAKHHFPLEIPQLAGEPLHYHWFGFAHLASASMISGVDTPVVFVRFALPTMCLLAVVLLAVVGWRVSGRPAVGAVATALNFAVGEVVVTTMAIQPIGSAVAFGVWHSQSVPYGWLMTIPMIALAVDRLTGGLPGSGPVSSGVARGTGPDQAPVGRGAWALLAMFALAAAGAKASILPVTLCAVGLVALVELVRRRPSRATWTVAGVLLGAQLFAIAVLFRFESLGLRVEPLGILWTYLDPTRERPWWKVVAIYGFVLVGYCVYLYSRLAGIPVLAWIRGRSWATVEWFLLGGIAGGALGTLVLWHPAWGQNYFVRSGFAFGAILSAMGVVALVDRHRVPARWMAVITVAVGGAAVASSVVLSRWGAGDGRPAWRGMLPIYWAGLAMGALAVTAVLVLVVARRRWPGLRGLASVVALTAVLGAGLPGLPWDAYLFPNARSRSHTHVGPEFHTRVGPDQFEAARWLRTNSGPDEILATNVHCAFLPSANCVSLSFWLSAYSERRILVESWAYSMAAVRAEADQQPWTPPALATNDRAFYAPDPTVLAWLRERGVRWLVVDRRVGQESAALGSLAELRWQRGAIAIYHLS